MTLQKIVALVLLVSMMLDAGLQATWNDLALLVRNVTLFAAALTANFVVVPLAAVLFVKLLHVNDAVSTGILLMAIAPGVPFVLLAGGRAKGGSHELAISLAVVLPVVSTFTLPFMADLVLPGSERASAPPGQLFGLVVYQFAPLLLGFIVAAFVPTATKLSRFLRPLTTVALIATLVIVAPLIANSAVTVFGSFGGVAMLLTVVASLAAGWFLAGPDREYRVTLAAGTALRNPAMALAVATTAFTAQAAVAAAVVTYFVVQAVTVAISGATVLKRRAET